MKMDNDRVSIPKDVMTGLPDGSRVCKDDLRMDACGTIDELNSFIGLLITEVPDEYVGYLQQIQRKLFAVGAYLVGVGSPAGMPGEEEVADLRKQVKRFMAQTGRLDHFILPGGCRAAAMGHVCRTVCRRAERCAVELQAYAVVPYLNRLSTYFFYLALVLNLFHQKHEINL